MSMRVRRPDILASLPPSHAVIEASAGTGKTYTLERLVVDVLLEGTARLDQLLVVTFTEKAAVEIRLRVRSILERLLEGTEPLAREGEPFWLVDDEARARLTTALRDFDAASISTIHGFCRRVLTETSFAAGRVFDQTLAPPDEVFEDVFRRLLRERFARDAHVVPYLEDHGADALRTLLRPLVGRRGLPLPDTRPLRDIAGELPVARGALDRVVAALEGAEKGKKLADARHAVVTLEAIVEDVRRGSEETAHVGRRYAAWCADLRTKAGSKNAVGKAIDEAFAHALGTEATSDLFFLLQSIVPTESARIAEACLPALEAELRRTKEAAGLFDFEDMIRLVVEALDGPGGDSLVETLRTRYRVALIDEFQDTDELQWRIFERVFLVPNRRLVVIGDPKQAIYGFRGGDLPTYLGAMTRILGADVPPAALDRNFRSTRAVIDAYNAIFACDGFFTAPNAYRVPVRCGRDDLAFVDASGRELPPVVVPDVVFEQGEKASAPRVRYRMARGIVDAIADVVSRGHLEETKAGERTRKRLGYDDVFVLVGKAHEGAYVADQFRAAGIPVAFFKQRGLFQTREAEDLLDVLRAVETPADTSRFVRAAQTMYFGHDVEDLERLSHAVDEHPLRATIRRLGVLSDRGDLSHLLAAILDESRISSRLLLCEDGERRRTNVEHLVDVLTMEAHGKGLVELVETFGSYVSGESLPEGDSGDLQRLESRVDAVQILTMHVAKGLERSVVAVFAPSGPGSSGTTAFVHDALGRRRLVIEPEDAIADRVASEAAEERQRLAYVALTRAKACLVLPRVLVPSGDDGETKPHAFKGSYAAIHPFLARLAAEAHPAFSVRVTAGSVDRAPVRRAYGFESVSLPAPFVLPAIDYGTLREKAAPVIDASFSLLHALGDDVRHADADSTLAAIGEGEIPPGRATGVLLHSLLERVPLVGVDETLEAFAERTCGLFDGVRLDTAHVRHAAKLVHAGLHASLPTHGGGSVSLARVAPSRVVREMDFLTPYLASDDYLTGSLDACFEHEGRIYVIDWKSNLLAGYGPDALRTDVAESYELQLRIYTLAAARFFGAHDRASYEERFGAVHYVYLRGLPEGGVYTRRPSFDELDAFREDLASRREGLYRG